MQAQYSTGIEFQEDPDWDKILREARRTDKLIFLDAYTSWCVPCKHMDKQVFSKEPEGSYFNRTFVNVKYDMDRGEGVRLKKHYKIEGFPTYLFINGEGKVVHKIFGAFTTEGEFLSYAKLSLIPGERTSDLEVRYSNGERNPKMMFSYLRMLRLTGQQEKEQQLAKEYLSLISLDHFLDPGYWEIIKVFIQDPISRDFQILLDNRELIGQKIGKAEVEQKIASVIETRLRQNGVTSTKAFDETTELKLIDFLRGSDFPRAREFQAKAMAQRYQRKQDWEMYASVVDAMLDFRILDSSDDPLSDLDGFAQILGDGSFDKKLLQRALRWSVYACENETRANKKDDFQQTRIRIVLKLKN